MLICVLKFSPNICIYIYIIILYIFFRIPACCFVANRNFWATTYSACFYHQQPPTCILNVRVNEQYTNILCRSLIVSVRIYWTKDVKAFKLKSKTFFFFVLINLDLWCLQAGDPGQSPEVVLPEEVAEEVKDKPVMLRSNKEDYYGSLSEGSENNDVCMDSLKVNAWCFCIIPTKITNCLFSFVWVSSQQVRSLLRPDTLWAQLRSSSEDKQL